MGVALVAGGAWERGVGADSVEREDYVAWQAVKGRTTEAGRFCFLPHPSGSLASCRKPFLRAKDADDDRRYTPGRAWRGLHPPLGRRTTTTAKDFFLFSQSALKLQTNI